MQIQVVLLLFMLTVVLFFPRISHDVACTPPVAAAIAAVPVTVISADASTVASAADAVAVAAADWEAKPTR